MKNSLSKPPVAAEWLLKRTTLRDDRQSVAGDFEEVFRLMQKEQGEAAAFFWYWMQALASLPSFLRYSTYWGISMLKNYLIISLRNLFKQKVFTVINILGLSIGMLCCILIYLYIADEVSFDRFHTNLDTIYRVVKNSYDVDGSIRFRGSYLPAPMKDDFVTEFPEMEDIVRISSARAVLRYKNKLFNEYLRVTDAGFLTLFTFPLISGSSSTALKNDNSIVMTESVARKYFGSDDPMGKVITVTFGKTKKDFIVTGITEDVHGNSTLQFKILINIANLPLYRGEHALTNRGDYSIPTYVRISDPVKAAAVESRFNSYIDRYFEKEIADSRKRGWCPPNGRPFYLSLQKMRDAHFDKNVAGGTDPKYSVILAGIALSVLLIACINFMNLSIGRSSVRFVEIGVRKVMGAGKRQLIGQFWCESLLLSIASLALSLFLTAVFIGKFNEFAGKQLGLSLLTQPVSIIALLLITAGTGILSGSYPALVMSAFRPVEILKGKCRFSGNNLLTKALVTIQFSLSVFLIISTAVMGGQLNYMLKKDTGFIKDGLLRISIQERDKDEAARIVKLFKERAGDYSSVEGITVTNASFGWGYSSYPVSKNGKNISVYQYRVDYDYIKTLGLTIVQGRNFSPEYATDNAAVIVSRKLLDELEITEPLGNTIGDPSLGYPYNLKIIGVIDNINALSFHTGVKPIILHMLKPWGFNSMLVRIQPDNITSTIAVLEKTWKEILPDKPFIYSFVSDDLKSQYLEENKWKNIVTWSSVFAILIAGMGIFGLTAITVNRRVKEIGIRKVLGARICQIVTLILRDYIWLVCLANLIAWPVVYVTMRNYLQDYYYRIPIGIQYFLYAGIISLAVAGITTAALAVRASLSNPADSIRYE